MQVFALYDTYYHFESAFNIILQKNKANILIVSCSLHLQGDPNYIYLIQFEPQIRQSITSCSETNGIFELSVKFPWNQKFLTRI